MEQLTEEEIEILLKEQEDGVLGFSDGEEPYCIPMGYQYIDKFIYLSFFQMGRKWSYLEKNKKVCFNVFSWSDDRSSWQSVIIDGVLEKVTDINEIKKVIQGNQIRFGLEDSYLEKKIEYYKNSMGNEKALKIYKIIPKKTGGTKMKRALGTSPLWKKQK